MLLYRKINEEGIWIDEVMLSQAPLLSELITETQKFYNKETDEMESIEVKVAHPILDEEGNPLPDPQYVAEPIPDGIYALSGICPQWNGMEWTANVEKPSQEPPEPTELEVLQQTVDSIFTEILPTLFG